MKKTSMQDIADYLGISKNAVSLALNNKPGIGKDLKTKIFQAARYLNYADFGILKAQDSDKNIVVMVPEYISSDRFFYPEIYWSIEKEARNQGFSAIMSIISADMEKEFIFPESIRSVKIFGILIIGVLNKRYIQKVLETGIDIVVVDNYYHDLAVGSVVTANEDGAYTITKHLIENGHRDIGYIAPIDMTSSFYERWQGFRKAMHDFDTPIDESFCILDSTPTKNFFTKPEELLPYIDNMERYPSAWFCGNDITAMVLINVLKRKNIQVPEDISVAGFDDIDAAHLFIPSLTTVNVKKGQMGREAVDCLIRKKSDSQQKMRLSLFPELVIRESVDKPSSP